MVLDFAPIPMINPITAIVPVLINNKEISLKYTYGTLDKKKHSQQLRRIPPFYYRGNTPSQGIDIRLGNRTISTRQLERIWTNSKDPESELSRHSDYNDFVGELCIPEPRPGTLTTVNNKSEVNINDPGWKTIFNKLNESFPPIAKKRRREEEEKQTELIKRIKNKYPNDEISAHHNHSVWPNPVYIDVYRKTKEGDVIIYELKTDDPSPLDLYQLKMYWDGLAVQGESPIKAILVCTCSDPHPKLQKLQGMAKQMNKFPPYDNSSPYNFKVIRFPYWDY